ncbi:MAG: WcaF family extracellular polysaccharide biosynthesis acetyltransferase [Pontiella sp.]
MEKIIDLSKFNNTAFSRGAPALKELLWRILQQGFFNVEWITAYGLKRRVLRGFGARLDSGVIFKPKAKVTFPWKLSVGANSWIGEEVWLLNLDPIQIGANVCISQRAFLCTGSHDWKKDSFDLITKPIVIGDGVWICADVFIGPGVTVGENSVVTAGSIVTQNLPPNMICSGNPCVAVKTR